jgi:D-alanine-D-alanine ligase
MTKKTTVALLFGGRSAEHEVSIRSASAIFNNLDKAKFRVISIFINKQGRWKKVASPLVSPNELSRGLFSSFLPWRNGGRALPVRADIYFPVLHGPYGEDGTIQGLLEMADVPYVGAGVLGSAVGMDKAVMKALFRSRELPVVKHRVFVETGWNKNPDKILRAVRREFRLPLFVKPANLGSSVGITKVRNQAQTRAAIELAFRYDRKILVEEGIRGRELECSVLGNDEPTASLPGEIMPHREFYDYSDKYLNGKTKFGIPADLPAALVKEVRRLAVEAYKACDGAGMARVDFFLESRTRRLYISEINTIPGFTEISMYPKLWEVSGLPFPRLVERLIELGFERHRAKKRCVTRIRSAS